MYYLGREDRLDNEKQEPITLTAFLKTERFLNRFRFARFAIIFHDLPLYSILLVLLWLKQIHGEGIEQSAVP